MTGQEAFEVAAAVAAISGLAALLVLALLGIVGMWLLFRQASEASLASTKAALGMDELARHLGSAQSATSTLEGDDEFARLRQEAEGLLEQQRRLQDMARTLIDTEGLEAGPPAGAVDELEAAINRLDNTVGQMATSLANLIQLLERQQEGR